MLPQLISDALFRIVTLIDLLVPVLTFPLNHLVIFYPDAASIVSVSFDNIF